MTKILFVCTGNLCRSPAAEAVFNALLREQGIEKSFACASVGTTDAFAGEPHDTRMAQVALESGFTITGKAKVFLPEHFSEYDYIIPMDSENRRFLLGLKPPENAKKKIVMFGQFNMLFDPDDVPDPFNLSEDQYRETFEIIVDGCRGLLRLLTESED